MKTKNKTNNATSTDTERLNWLANFSWEHEHGWENDNVSHGKKVGVRLKFDSCTIQSDLYWDDDEDEMLDYDFWDKYAPQYMYGIGDTYADALRDAIDKASVKLNAVITMYKLFRTERNSPLSEKHLKMFQSYGIKNIK